MSTRFLATLGLAIAIIVVASAGAGRLGGSLGLVLVAFGLVWNHVMLPRSASRAFRRGALAAARRRYRWLRVTALSRRGAMRAQLSAVGCLLAEGRYPDGLTVLGRIVERDLDVDSRAVWLNNRAYATLRLPVVASETALTALAWAEEAGRLRPDVPEIAHTRAMALRAAGRADQSIALLDSMWTEAGLAPRLEAERCWELAQAWRSKGEGAYADDYRGRAEQLIAGLGTPAPWA